VNILTCPRCGAPLCGFIPAGCKCGFSVPVVNGVYRFTDDEPIAAAGKELQWLGYEQVGENFEPGYVYDRNADTIGHSHNLAAFLGDGKVVLDIGTGLGASAVSFALAGLKVIAADISQVMLEAAFRRAGQHNVVQGQILFARMNGYRLALADSSVDAVLEVDMLQQVNRPDLVIAEILRVLKPEGFLLQYGGGASAPYTAAEQSANEHYNAVLGDLQDYYDAAVKAAGYTEALFSSWNEAAQEVAGHFAVAATLEDTGCYDVKGKVWTLAMGLHKTKTRASGSKQLIPDAVHETAWAKTDAYAREKYGEDYGSIPRYFNSRSSIIALSRK
jgi:ubiquinone/menaquinone biosynthesis C-methylase UbiE